MNLRESLVNIIESALYSGKVSVQDRVIAKKYTCSVCPPEEPTYINY